jgi:DNA-binding transcriptional LysR family regulator
MELRHLRVLIAVADELHFGRAAERLNLTQPSVSAHIRQLEQELEVRLLDRGPRQVVLTEAGRVFLNDARRIVRHADAASSGIRSWRQGKSTRLRVGYVGDALPRALPVALRRFSASTDTPNVQLTTGASHELIAHVQDESLDVAIVSLPAPIRGMHVWRPRSRAAATRRQPS